MKTIMANDKVFSFKASAEQVALLEQAAEVVGKEVGELALDASVLSAQNTLLDQRIFSISEEQYAHLQGFVADPENEQRIQKILSFPDPWN